MEVGEKVQSCKWFVKQIGAAKVNHSTRNHFWGGHGCPSNQLRLSLTSGGGHVSTDSLNTCNFSLAKTPKNPIAGFVLKVKGKA